MIEDTVDPSAQGRRAGAPAASIVPLALALLAFGVCGLVTSVGLWWQHVRASRQLADGAKQRASAETARTAAQIDALLSGIMPLTGRVAEALAAPGLTEAQIGERLTTLANTTTAASGLGAAYQASALPRGRRLFAPYVLIDHQRAGRRVQIEDRYDYTKFEHRWYGDPLLEGAMWNEPVQNPWAGGMVAVYAQPIVRPGADRRAEPIGIAFTTVPLEAITRLLDALALGTSGYGFVFSSQGRYISHPRADLVARGKSVFETAWTAGDTALHRLAIHGLKGERGLVASIDPRTGQESWVVYEPIKATGWTLAVVYFQDAFRLNADRQRRDIFRVTTAAIAGVLLIGLGLFAVLVAGRVTWLWLLASGVSAVVGAGIVVLWAASSWYPPRDMKDQTRVLDAASAEQYLRAYEREAGHTLERLPTGIYVKSIEFLSSVNVAVSGYVWQRLPAPAPARPEFVLADADKPEIREISRHRSGADEIVMWSFAANIRESFSYEKYPFDQQDVWIRLRPASMERSAVLVPELASYVVSDPAARPGLEAGLVLPGWQLTSSSFDFRTASYNTNFGLERFDAATAPELYFNVSVTRRFLGPFVSNVVPLTVAGMMVFALLIISSKNESRSRFAGFTAKDIVKGAAAVFFVISFQHIALRNALGSARLIYFEYFYFTAYLGVILVTLNGILFASGLGGALVQYRDNLLPKIAFWPTAMACLFVVSVLTFF